MSKARGFRPEANNLFLGLFTLALTFPVSVMVARVLGPEGRGTYALVVMYSAIVALVAAGGYPDAVPNAVGRESNRSAALVLEGHLLRRASRTAVVWGGAVGLFLLWRGESWIALAVASATVTVLGAVWPFYLQAGAALGSVSLPAQAEALRVVVYAAGALALWMMGALTPTSAVFAFAWSYLVGEIVSRQRLTLQGAPRLDVMVARRISTSARRLGRRAMLGRVMEYAATRADLLIVGALLGARAAGLYAVAIALTEPLLLAANAATGTVIAEAVRGDAVATRRFVLSRTGMVMAVAGAGALVVVLVGPMVLSLAFGAEFAEALLPLRLLAVAFVFGCGVRVLRTVNVGLARPRANWLADLSALAVIVVGNLLLLREGGLAVAATVQIVALGAACVVLGMGLFVTNGAPLARLRT